MIENRLKAHWRDNKSTLNGWLAINSPFVSEIMADQGYDSLTVDLQHGAVDYEGMLAMLQAMRASNVVPMVRVAWNDPGLIMKALDAGAYGIICPMINDASQAKQFVTSLRYPPRGERSFGPTRANFSAGPGYAQQANDEIVGFAMIETAQAYENLEEIVATPGLDGVYIGPSDLTLGLTQGRLMPGLDRTEPEMVEAIQHILKTAKNAGLYAGIHCGSPEYAAKALEWGFNFTTLSNDVRLLAAAASNFIKQVRGQRTNPNESDRGGGY
ncbi:MAG: 2,4-dihydroxyhept-2-ene-1,7-dioic acid aldolase [SAR116 cluster bacterium]|nr:MAG: 2,4-dihydroxyhept-2-ene-1,7-dioic acid aldolase [SAR116 cluster bacterium]HBQ22398.1 2,4-dihydroxyhept-2-ene-1,7-dioic acid aldolase [Alphaproteobacteria bacterium]HCJ62620.1 2,4-dihydroxyhept-2-ene-1,7-dioic acid aldolase [Alphaproteobacteria bacterium]|tara:strand:- start:1937 stop:2746 length:810 start_codon:yes stop_codon:yes gene_type:complete